MREIIGKILRLIAKERMRNRGDLDGEMLNNLATLVKQRQARAPSSVHRSLQTPAALFIKLFTAAGSTSCSRPGFFSRYKYR